MKFISIILIALFPLGGITPVDSITPLKNPIVGKWVHHKTVKGIHYDIKIYQRSTYPKIYDYEFSDNGLYTQKVNFTRKCGNQKPIKPLIRQGEFKYNSKAKEIHFYATNNTKMKSWKLVWLDANSFGLKVYK